MPWISQQASQPEPVAFCFVLILLCSRKHVLRGSFFVISWKQVTAKTILAMDLLSTLPDLEQNFALSTDLGAFFRLPFKSLKTGDISQMLNGECCQSDLVKRESF